MNLKLTGMKQSDSTGKLKWNLFAIALFLVFVGSVLGQGSSELTSNNFRKWYVEQSVNRWKNGGEQALCFFTDSTFLSNFNQGKYEQARIANQFTTVHYADEISARNLGVMTMRMGIVNFKLGRTLEALDCYQVADSLFQFIDDSSLYAALFTNFGVIKAFFGKEKEALRYFLKALEYNKNASTKVLALNYTNIGTRFVNLKDYDKAIHYYRKAHLLSKDEPDSLRLFKVEINLSRCYRLQKQFDLSEKYYKQAESLMPGLVRQEFWQGIINLYKGHHFFDKGMNDSALFYLNLAEGGSEYLNELRRSEIYDLLHQVYEKEGELDKAFTYLKLYSGIKEKVLTKEQLAWERRDAKENVLNEKAKQIDLLEKDNFLQIIVTWISIGLSLLILFLLWRNKFKSNKEKVQLTAGKIWTEEKLKCEKEEKDKINKALEVMKREEVSRNIMMIHHQRLLESLECLIKNMGIEGKTENHKQLRELEVLKREWKSMESYWDDFKVAFEAVNPKFYVSMNKRYPDLTTGELRMCALIKLNLSTEQMSTILRVSTNSIKTSRYRIRKKMNLSKTDDLPNIIFQHTSLVS